MTTQLTDRDRILLTKLADGVVQGGRAEARLREIPDGARLLERQARVRRALRDGPAPSPGPPRSRRPRCRGRRAGRRGSRSRVAALLAAVVLVVQPTGPSIVAEAAELAHEPATDPAPASAGRLLEARVDGVPFPDWSRDFGWQESGTRRDTLGGRATTTVFYEHMGHRIAYTILPGPAVHPPEGSRIVRRDGLEIALSHDPRRDHDIAVFERDGRTCVLAGHVERVSTLVKLAAWTARA